MAARCWGCAVGVAPVGAAVGELPLDPLGACWDCHVFGCEAHAARDRHAGKWLCFPSVAGALAASAGVALPQTDVRFEDQADFEARFNALAEATAELRNDWRPGSREGHLGR